MISKLKRTILINQLQDALQMIAESGMGLIIESDTILLVSRSEVERARKCNIGQEVEGQLPGPVQVLTELRDVSFIDDCGVLLGAGAACVAAGGVEL